MNKKYFLSFLFAILLFSVANAQPDEHQVTGSNQMVIGGSIPTLTVTWPEFKKGCCGLYQGDCHQIEGTLVLHADGKAHFSCVTWTDSTHSGDYWHVAFEFLDHSGVSLFHSPTHIGPRMDDGHPSPRYRWEFDFTFDPSLFNRVASVTQNFGC